MTILKNSNFVFVLVLGAAAAGCATSGPTEPPGSGSGSDTGSGSGSGSGGGEGTPTPLDMTGKYSVVSTYDISANMPGTAGAVFNNFTQAATDPGKWILDKIIANTSGFIHTALQGAEPFVASLIDQQIDNYAPSFVMTIQQVGDDLGQMAKKFGINETYDVSGSGGAYVATDTATGLHFKVDTLEEDFAFADYQMQNVVANNVTVTIDTTGKVTIGEHKLPLSYGKMLHIGLDNMVIPNVDPNASNLDDLLNDLIDCQSVGQALADNVGLISQGSWASLCTAGLQLGAQQIYNQLDGIDSSALEFDITGSVKGVDTNNDKKVDSLQLGKWQGTLSYGGTPAPLSTATFVGTRM